MAMASVLKKGFFQVRTDYSNIAVDYREHDSRNGRLLVLLDDNPVGAEILREVTDRLKVIRSVYRRT